MKRIIAFLLIFVLGVVLAGCSAQSEEGTASKVKQENTDTDDYADEKEPLELKENTKYVLVAIKSKYVVVESEEDFANLKVAYIGGTDGEAYAKHYDFAEIGMYNAPNDLHSGIKGKDFDAGLIDEEKLSTYDDWEVVWEMEQ